MPNRIRELRERAGLTLAQLAAMVGTTQPQMTRLERGERRLTADWMARIATALRVQPVDLLAEATLAEFGDEAEVYVGGDNEVGKALAGRELVIYKVTSDSVEQAGVRSNQIAVFDCSEKATSSPENGSIVLALLRSTDTPDQQRLIVRQYLAPGLLVTNRRGPNTVISSMGPLLSAKIIGVMVPGRRTT